MTVEELNVKITADAGGFREEIALVNTSLDSLRENVKKAGIEAVAAFTGLMRVGTLAESRDVQYETAAVTETGESDFFAGGQQTNYLNTLAPTAKIQNFRRGETVIGALNGGGAQDNPQQPIQINTTVELDGDTIGEAVAFYNAKRRRASNE